MSIDYEIARIIIDEILPYSLEYYLGVEGLKETGEAEEARVEKEDKITNLLS
jgi:nucleosome assembly protein 1-like 1